MPATRTWAGVWTAMDESERSLIRNATHSRLVVPPSDLEVRVIKLLIKHNEPFEWQIKARPTRFTIDFKVRGQYWETYGCGYHQCPTCGNNWWPQVRAKDRDRKTKLEKYGYRYSVIWNHELDKAIEGRLFVPWHPDRPTQLTCTERYGTHECSQLNKHDGVHYCVCVGDEHKIWKTGAKAPLSAYNPKLLKAVHVQELRERKLI